MTIDQWPWLCTIQIYVIEPDIKTNRRWPTFQMWQVHSYIFTVTWVILLFEDKNGSIFEVRRVGQVVEFGWISVHQIFVTRVHLVPIGKQVRQLDFAVDPAFVKQNVITLGSWEPDQSPAALFGQAPSLGHGDEVTPWVQLVAIPTKDIHLFDFSWTCIRNSIQFAFISYAVWSYLLSSYLL